MSKRNDLITALFKKTADNTLKWYILVKKEEIKSIDDYNLKKYYTINDFDGFVAYISNQKVFCLREIIQNSFNNHYYYSVYVSNTEGTIVTKILADDIDDKSILSDLYTIISRAVDESDLNIDNILNIINKPIKF